MKAVLFLFWFAKNHVDLARTTKIKLVLAGAIIITSDIVDKEQSSLLNKNLEFNDSKLVAK